MAWEKTQTLPGRMQVWTNTYTASAGAAFTAASITGVIGEFQRIEWVPGSTTPDSSVNLTVTNDNGLDILNGAGTGVDMTAAGFAEPKDANNSPKLVPVRGALSIQVASNSTASAIVTLTVYVIP